MMGGGWGRGVVLVSENVTNVQITRRCAVDWVSCVKEEMLDKHQASRDYS